ncbi:hypothetical protein AFK24_15095 [Pseudomonas syringae]|uniref:Delta-60 repeat protein n=1 Tax=Pseudomonas syringae TaxID=317 RepID=A0A1C7Z2K6_PSESX|nr:hypothetical protein [Pseudomonas syringae]OCR24252.1 hypothetical protein AFK24_15095 [Pseudomonas syringae]
MESTLNSRHLALEEQAFKAPIQRNSSDRASPLNPLQYDETFGRDGKLLINMGGRRTSWVSSIVQLRNSSKYLATYYEALAPGNPDPYINNAGVARFDSSGNIDTSFGARADGTVDIRFGATDYSFPQQIIELENGQLLVIGEHRRLSNTQFLHVTMTRLASDGSLDTSFGNDGVLNITSLANRAIRTVGTVVLPDGKIIMAATIAEEGPIRSFLIKLTPDGRLDESFAGQGILELQRSPATGTYLSGLKLVEERTRLFTYGYYGSAAGHEVGFMTRLDTDGNFDTNFGQSGFVDLEPNEPILIRDVSISSDEAHLLVTGLHFNRELRIEESLLARCLTNGKPDKRFNQGKPVYLRFHPTSTYDLWNDARTLMDEAGKIVVFGSGGTPTDSWSVAGRFHSTGKPDTSFAEGSSVGSPPGASFFPRGSYVEGSNPRTILCAGAAEGSGAVLAIKV